MAVIAAIDIGNVVDDRLNFAILLDGDFHRAGILLIARFRLPASCVLSVFNAVRCFLRYRPTGEAPDSSGCCYLRLTHHAAPASPAYRAALFSPAGKQNNYNSG